MTIRYRKAINHTHVSQNIGASNEDPNSLVLNFELKKNPRRILAKHRRASFLLRILNEMAKDITSLQRRIYTEKVIPLDPEGSLVRFDDLLQFVWCLFIQRSLREQVSAASIEDISSEIRAIKYGFINILIQFAC